MSTQDRLYYVFGIGGHALEHLPENVGQIIENGLSIFYQPVAYEEFNEQALKAHLEDPKWVTRQAVAHQQKVQAIFERSPALVPFRFGTIFENEASLKDVLLEKQQEWKEKLATLEGKAEWDLKAFEQEDELEAAVLAQNSELKQSKEAIAAATPGRAFLLKRQWAHQWQNAVSQHHQWFIQEVARHANTWPFSLVWKNKSSGTDQQAPEAVWQMALLGPREPFDTFRPKILPLLQELPEQGYKFSINGPWPAYHFT